MVGVALGADHVGFEIKDELEIYLLKKGYRVIDFGADSSQPADYPIYAVKVARHVRTTGDLGILVCGSGIGMSMAANRYEGVYAARCVNAREAEVARSTGANILCLGGKSPFEDTVAIVDAFLKTEFSGEERHIKRLALIDELARS